MGYFVKTKVWSIADHGPNECLVEKLRPLLHKYNVSAYICGHDHNLQHISDTHMNRTVNYFVSGAGNFITRSTKNAGNIPIDSLIYNWGSGGVVVYGGLALVRANSQSMTVTFIRSRKSGMLGERHGKILYETTIYPRK